MLQNLVQRKPCSRFRFFCHDREFWTLSRIPQSMRTKRAQISGMVNLTFFALYANLTQFEMLEIEVLWPCSKFGAWFRKQRIYKFPYSRKLQLIAKPKASENCFLKTVHLEVGPLDLSKVRKTTTSVKSTKFCFSNERFKTCKWSHKTPLNAYYLRVLVSLPIKYVFQTNNCNHNLPAFSYQKTS